MSIELDAALSLGYTHACLGVSSMPLTQMESTVSRPVRSSRPRRPVARPSNSPATAVSAAPPVRTVADLNPAAHTSTRITTTDYGYVVGELRRIALLTVVIVALLLIAWVIAG